MTNVNCPLIAASPSSAGHVLHFVADLRYLRRALRHNTGVLNKHGHPVRTLTVPSASGSECNMFVAVCRLVLLFGRLSGRFHPLLQDQRSAVLPPQGGVVNGGVALGGGGRSEERGPQPAAHLRCVFAERQP
ncbi:unnamed protein product [Prorocentrum cordatum]|uniref:Uncharacterized protein n=1 Tax=Prorocentrum cordatum TaxID=2364126 RepID=A0ABN9TW21_9DINO|nr:unnamed protein product [Polarella glacialis]